MFLLLRIKGMVKTELRISKGTKWKVFSMNHIHLPWYFQIMSKMNKPDIWSAIQESLVNLSLEYRSTSGHFQVTSEASQISEIPKREKISILKMPPVKNKAGGGGVKHLNLIQIKGNPAHSWQPRMEMEKSNKVVRPDIRGLEMNQLLLKMKKTK